MSRDPIGIATSIEGSIHEATREVIRRSVAGIRQVRYHLASRHGAKISIGTGSRRQRNRKGYRYGGLPATTTVGRRHRKVGELTRIEREAS